MKNFQCWLFSQIRFNQFPTFENYISYLHQHYNIVKDNDSDESFKPEIYINPIKKKITEKLDKCEIYSKEEKVYVSFLKILQDENLTKGLYYYLANKPTEYKGAYKYIYDYKVSTNSANETKFELKLNEIELTNNKVNFISDGTSIGKSENSILCHDEENENLENLDISEKIKSDNNNATEVCIEQIGGKVNKINGLSYIIGIQIHYELLRKLDEYNELKKSNIKLVNAINEIFKVNITVNQVKNNKKHIYLEINNKTNKSANRLKQIKNSYLDVINNPSIFCKDVSHRCYEVYSPPGF